MLMERKKYLNLFLKFFIVLCILQILDLTFTTYMINVDGTTEIEKNPFMRYIFELPNGVFWALLLKIGFMFLWFIPAYLWIYHPINFYKKIQRDLFIFVPSFATAVYGVVVAFEIFQIGVYYLWF